MRASSIVAVFAATGLSVASPIEKRVTTPVVDDTIILNYALTLEYLERAFYRQGIAQFSEADFVASGFPDPFYANLEEIYSDEKTHVSFLAGALGAAATHELTYSFPYTDPKSFVTLSSVLEGVGVSAYLGAAASIANPDYLTAAGSILTVESRHSAYIRASLGESPFPTPFDTPLDFNQVYSLAAAFITSLAGSAPLPFMAFPSLTLQCTQYYYQSGGGTGSSVTFSNGFTNAMAFNSAITASTPIYAIFFSGLQKLPVQVRITRGNKDYKIDTIPAGIAGQVYVMLGTSDTVFTDETFIAGPAILEVYPHGEIPWTPHAKCT